MSRMSEGMIPPEYVDKPGIRWLHLRFPDGSVWKVDPEPVASARAEYYARHDLNLSKDEKVSTGLSAEWRRLFWKEFHYAIRDRAELEDYMMNNMNWDDLPEKEMIRYPDSIKPDYYKDNFFETEVIGSAI